MVTAESALALERTGPLVAPVTLLIGGLAFGALLALAAHQRVRVRYPALLPELTVVAVLAALHLLFFWQPYRSEARVPKGGGDLASFFYPMHAFAAREVQDGRLPYWNPHLFSGAPHLANFQTATLYPPNLVAYLLARPFEYAALEQLALLHYLLVSWGVYLLARALGIGRPGAVLAGAICAYSGFFVAHLGHYSMLATASWMPLVYAAIVASVRRASWLAALGGALALTCAVLGGHQPILLMSLTLAVALAGFELWRRHWCAEAGHGLRELVRPGWDLRSLRDGVARIRRCSPLWGDVRRLAFIAVAALLLSLPVLGPSFELTGRTIRGSLSYRDASSFSVEPTALLHLVTPTVFGSNPTDYWGPFSNTEIWGYAGVLTLFLAALGALALRSRTRMFWVVVAALGLLYVVGPFAALHGWVYAFLPGFDRVRAAGRAYMFVNLALALLAGFGLQALMRDAGGRTVRERLLLARGVWVLGATLVFVLAVPVPLMAARILGVNDPGNRPVIALDNLLLLALWLALGLGVLLAIWRGALRGGALLVAVFAVVLLDLFAATAPFNPTTSRLLGGFQHPESIAFLRERQAQDGPFRIEVLTPRWQPNLALLAGLDDIGGLFDPLAPAQYERYRAAAVADRSSAAYHDLNARFIIGDDELSPPAGYREAFRAPDGIVIWEAPEWRPRAWLEGADAAVAVTVTSSAALEIVVPEGAAGRLVVSQADYPGWRATVDGRETPVETYDGALQAITLPADARVVELRFAPNRFGVWLVLALGGVLCWLAVAAYQGRRAWQGRRQRVSSEAPEEGATV